MKPVVFCPGSLRAGLEPRFGARRFATFLQAGGNPGHLDDPEPREIAARLGLPPPTARMLARRLRRWDLEQVVDEARSRRAEIITWGDPRYPSSLTELADPPPCLFWRGEPWARDELGVAVVGARKASPYGLRMARTLAGDLARAGVTVVSGLARGVDAAAHEAVLAAGGRTIAVLGCGLARPYPPEHATLLESVLDRGAACSEFALDAPPRAHQFPQRNRILAALSAAVVVVEAGARSGALSTAHHALDLGREVLAVPGAVDREQSVGTMLLLRDGATPVAGVQDVLGALGYCDPKPLSLPETEQKVLETIPPAGATAEEVDAALGIGADVAAGYLVTLEVRGLVEREIGGRYVVR
ncbi:MAG: DNA-processing protein DprA [Planctomycetota bacterium]